MTDTTTGQALMRAILLNPADETVRLIYADWCEETGDVDKAAFIRVQIKLSKFTPDDLRCMKTGKPTEWHKFTPHCRCSVCRLRRQEYETSKRHCVWEWSGPAATLYYIYRRGFVAEAHCSCKEWQQRGPAVVRTLPVERVLLTDAIEYHGGQPAVTPDRLGPIYSVLWPTPRGEQGIFDSNRARLENKLSAAALLWARNEAGLPALSDT